jgi:hypothetical protein
MNRIKWFACLAIAALCGCTTTSRTVISPEVLKMRVPPALIAKCKIPDSRKWKTVKDIVDTANVNESRLKACAAQVDGVREWDSIN